MVATTPSARRWRYEHAEKRSASGKFLALLRRWSKSAAEHDGQRQRRLSEGDRSRGARLTAASSKYPWRGRPQRTWPSHLVTAAHSIALLVDDHIQRGSLRRLARPTGGQSAQQRAASSPSRGGSSGLWTSVRPGPRLARSAHERLRAFCSLIRSAATRRGNSPRPSHRPGTLGEHRGQPLVPTTTPCRRPLTG